MKRFLSVLLACALSTMAVPALALEPDSNQEASPAIEQPLSSDSEEKAQSSDEPDSGDPADGSTEGTTPAGDQANSAPSAVSQAETSQTSTPAEDNPTALQATGQAFTFAEINVEYGDFAVNAIGYYKPEEANPEEQLRSTLSFEEDKGPSGTLIIGNASQTDANEGYYTIRMKEGIGQTKCAIEIRTPNLEGTYDCDVSVTLENVSIDTGVLSNTPAVRIAEGAGIVDVRTVGETTLASSYGYAGIQKDNSAKGENGTLIVSGASGSVLHVTGGWGSAGIGSGYAADGDSVVQNITINSVGTIEATGGSGAAGIGSGRADKGGSKATYIAIKNGTVLAAGGYAGCGIGSGRAGKEGVGGTSEAGFISIEGGDLQAQGDRYAAGIGSAASLNMDSWAHEITVTDGTVKATGGVTAAGIGSGWARTSSHANDFKFLGGNVQATGGNGGAGIGSGFASNGESLARFFTFSGGTIEAQGGNSEHSGEGDSESIIGAGVGIGSGWAESNNSACNDIKVSGALVTAKAGTDADSVSGAPGVGSGWAKAGTSRLMNVTISNGRLEAYGSASAAPAGSEPAQLPAIGAGYGSSGSTVTQASVAPDDAFVGNVSRGASAEDCTQTSVVPGSPLPIGGKDWECAYAKVRVIPASNLTVTGGETVSDDDGTVVLTQSVTYTVTSHGNVSRNGLRVAAGVSPTVVLDGVNIDVSTFSGRGAVLIPADAGAVTLKLKGENTLKSGASVAGIQKNTNSDAELIITSAAGAGSMDGLLTATGGWGGAGIGSGYAADGDSVADGIRLMGGTITANGGSGAPGIGAGYSPAGTSNAMNITIEGGTITAEGFGKNGAFAAGIGSGRGANSTAAGITIASGTVKATGGKNSAGAGIGSGFADSDQGVSSAMNILVSGGSIEAYSSNGAAALGSGRGNAQSIALGITISGGTVVAKKSANSFGWNNVGIGSGAAGQEPRSGDASKYAVSGDTVSSGYSKASNIVISGGTVTAAGTNGGSAIGSGYVEKGGTTITEAISITGGTVEATGGTGGWHADECTYGAPAFGPSEVVNTGENPATAVFPESVQMQAAKAGQLLDVWKGASAEGAQHVVAGSVSPYALTDRDAYVKAAFADPEAPLNPGDTPSGAQQPAQIGQGTLAATGDSLLPLGVALVVAFAGLVVATAARKRRNRVEEPLPR